MKRFLVVAIFGATVLAVPSANLAAKGRCGDLSSFDSDSLDPESLRALVVFHRERETDAIAAARGLGANVVVTHSAPDEATAAAARAAGVGYIAYLSTAEIDRAWEDPAVHARYAAMRGVGGVYFEDADVLEGYTSVEDQARAYRRLKELFPRALAIHPTRLDPILFDAEYLDAIYRPELTDVVTPYYYPVGTTLFGWFSEGDAWSGMLEPMLRELAGRTPAGKPILPVLQGFEQEGFPVGAAFVAEQFDAYRGVWPGNQSAAIFEWGGSPDPSPDSPLVGLAFRPELAAGTRRLFRALQRAAASESCTEKSIDSTVRRGTR
jgi:hypothetical protein